MSRRISFHFAHWPSYLIPLLQIELLFMTFHLWSETIPQKGYALPISMPGDLHVWCLDLQHLFENIWKRDNKFLMSISPWNVLFIKLWIKNIFKYAWLFGWHRNRNKWLSFNYFVMSCFCLTFYSYKYHINPDTKRQEEL